MQKSKEKTKLISSLKINNHVVTEKCLLKNHIEEHFKYLFNQASTLQDNGLIEETIPSLVNEHINTIITNQSSAKEIHQAVKNLNGDGAHRPDGFGAFFLLTVLEGHQD